MIEDQRARRDALNPAESFIVQAPAGSGKTELLTQRYLSLLGQACEFPEEIIAITFTRKAAAQMRERVIGALTLAQDPQPPAAAHRHTAWQLAREVHRKDQDQQWRLLENPQRLRILTIDALCAQLSNRLPLLAGYGAPARIADDARPYYQQAVRELMLQDTPVELLAHLDNNAEKLMQLCVELLAKREQWLPYIIYHGTLPELRQKLEQGLAQLAQEILAATQRQFAPDLLAALLPLLRFAGNNLHTQQSPHLLTHWHNRTALPQPTATELILWRGLTQALLTTEGEWRKTIDIRNGFPPKTAEKNAFIEILAVLTSNTALRGLLRQILLCPPICYDDQQWQMITALLNTLPLLVAQLQLIFQRQGVMDFVELGLAASRALGEEQQPTDLALSLDYRIRHLLVDEFQDTSVAQFKLLEKLLLGWEPGDGRSIFLVGDPMQSIYRFRNAEVGLFLRATDQGVQQIPLTPLKLALNFRSGENLIAWFNQIFPQILPPQTDLTSGAVPYTAAVATQPQIAGPAVCGYAFQNSTDATQQVVAIIQQLRRQHPDQTIAVLVRTRTHLLNIIPALQAVALKFQAVDIEPLATRSEIQDLVALTRALHHRADRIAWLAVLRAPYCGLTLADLHIIAQAAEHRTIYEVLLDYHHLSLQTQAEQSNTVFLTGVELDCSARTRNDATLSHDAQQRLSRVVPVLMQALQNQGRLPLAEWVEGVWLALGGPAGLQQPNELLNAAAYYQLLRQLTQNQAALDMEQLDQQLQNLYAAPDAQASANLQIMTIHKAKGLEFDHVILPELQRKPIADSSRLLLWMEKAGARTGSHLILAPIKAACANSDPMYAYLKEMERQKLNYEAERLLYVAATRAKQSLHLLAVLPDVPDPKAWQPPSGSFLQMLWPYFREQLLDAAVPATSNNDSANRLLPRPIIRLTADWQLPPNIISPFAGEVGAQQPVKDDLQLRNPMPHSHPSPTVLRTSTSPTGGEVRIGTVVHEALALLAQQAPHFQDLNTDHRWERRLRQLGMTAEDISAALPLIRQALQNILHDPRGLWILSAEHRDRRSEYALSAVLNGEVVHSVFDRTFIDADDIRWIIDYKTGAQTHQALDGYRQQLLRYAQIMALRETRPIRLGIYFPLCCTWQEWAYNPIALENER